MLCITFVCWDFIESAIDGRPIDDTVIDVVLVRGAILTCFFGSTLAYDFFMAFDLREIGETLAVFRSTFLLDAVAVTTVAVAIAVPPFVDNDNDDDDDDDDDGSVSIFVDMPFNVLVSHNIFDSSFCCEVKCAIAVGRTTTLVKSFRRLGSAFI